MHYKKTLKYLRETGIHPHVLVVAARLSKGEDVFSIDVAPEALDSPYLKNLGGVVYPTKALRPLIKEVMKIGKGQ